MTRTLSLAIVVLTAWSESAAAGSVQSIPQFNPAGGTLTSVRLDVVGTARQSFAVPFTVPGFPAPPPPSPSYGFLGIVTVFIGSNLFYNASVSGSVPLQGNRLEVVAPFSFAIVDANPANLSYYVGTGTLIAPVAASFRLVPTDGSMETDGPVLVFAVVQVQYSTLPVSHSSAPSSGWMALIAILVLCARKGIS